MAVRYRKGKVVKDQFNCSQCRSVRYRIRTGCNQSFDSMGQGIHTGCGCKGCRLVNHQLRIVNRNRCQAILINHHHFNLAFFISNDIVNSYFSRGACRCIYCNNRQSLIFRFVNAFILRNITTICGNNTDCLCCILRRTSTDGD
ncbi:hypothetical protein D3C78_1084110 [compost metagenome]